MHICVYSCVVVLLYLYLYACEVYLCVFMCIYVHSCEFKGGVGLGPGKAAGSTRSGEWWANGEEHIMANGDVMSYHIWSYYIIG